MIGKETVKASEVFGCLTSELHPGEETKSMGKETAKASELFACSRSGFDTLDEEVRSEIIPSSHTSKEKRRIMKSVYMQSSISKNG